MSYKHLHFHIYKNVPERCPTPHIDPYGNWGSSSKYMQMTGKYYRCDLPEIPFEKEWSCPVANDLKAVRKVNGDARPNPPPNPGSSRKKWQNTLRGMQANRTATVKSGSSVKNPCAPRETALTGKILMDIGIVTAMEDTPKFRCSIGNTSLKGPSALLDS